MSKKEELNKEEKLFKYVNVLYKDNVKGDEGGEDS